MSATTPTEIDDIPFRRVLGQSERVGWGSLRIAYSVYIEEGIDIRARAFAHTIDAILGDERGWIRSGKQTFQRVPPRDANTMCILATPDTVDKLCYPLDTAGEVSCCQGSRVVLNIDRWRKGVPHWTGPLKTYRQMVVNHEFGHRQGKPHRWCQKAGEPAAVMVQQTYGLQGCRENSWPLDSEL